MHNFAPTKLEYNYSLQSMFHFGLYHIPVTDVWKGIHVPVNALNIMFTHFEAIKNIKCIHVNGPDIFITILMSGFLFYNCTITIF